MIESRRFGVVDFSLLVFVLLLAWGARSWYLGACAEQGSSAGPLRVQDPSPTLVLAGSPSESQSLVRNLHEHRWFGTLAPLASSEEQTAHTAPGFTWLLAGIERVQAEPSAAEHLVRWAHSVLGAFTAGIYFLFARRAFQSVTVALLAGVFVALDPFHIVATAEVQDGVLTAFLVAFCVFLGGRGAHTGGAFTSLLFGLGLAGLTLVRAALLPFAFVSMLWYLRRVRTLPRGWLCAFLAVLGFVNGLAPWTMRNLQVFHDVFPIVDSTYLHLWMGNNPKATGGPVDEATLLAALAEQRHEDLQSVTDELARLPQRERYQRLAPAVIESLRSDPARALQHRLNAALAFLFGEQWLRDRTLWQVNSSESSGSSWWDGHYPLLFYAALLGMLCLGFLGWRWSYGWAFESMPLSLALLWIPLPYLLSHAEVLSGPRLPLDGVLCCFAAFAVASVLPRGGLLFDGATPPGRNLR